MTLLMTLRLCIYILMMMMTSSRMAYYRCNNMHLSSNLLLVPHGSVTMHIYHDDAWWYTYFTELQFAECQSHGITTMRIYLNDADEFIKDCVNAITYQQQSSFSFAWDYNYAYISWWCRWFWRFLQNVEFTTL